MSSHKHKLYLSLGFILLLLANRAQALAIYDSDAFSTFTVLSDGGMDLTISTPFEASMTAVTGTGAVSVDADSQVAAFPVYTLESDVSGSAGGPFGTSVAEVLNGLFVELDNTAGTDPATAIFRFSYEWSALITRTDPLEESVSASPLFQLTGFAPSGDETLAIDDLLGGGPVSVSDWLVNPAIGLSLGGSLLSDSASGDATVLAYVTVPEGGFDSFSVLTDSAGSAVHIPAPGSLVLVITGLIGFRLRRNT